MENTQPSKKVKRLLDLFMQAHANSRAVFEERHRRQEFYYNDVEGTLSQLTESQKEFVEKNTGIPISTKLSYPIIEQIISFLTGPKPFPKLIASSNRTEEFTKAMSAAFYGVWYESKANEEMKKAVKDAVVVGSGYNRIRKNNFFEETTFNVVVKNIPWHTVFVDPQSREADFRDAEYICVAEVMTKAKAEKQYDIKLGKIGGQEYPHNLFIQAPAIQVKEYWSITDANIADEKWVIALEVFEKVENNVYISEKGDMSSDRPTPTEIPNPEKEALKLQLVEMTNARTELKQQVKETTQDADELQSQDKFQSTEEVQEHGAVNQELQQENTQQQEQIKQLNAQIKEINTAINQMPNTVPAYKMLTVKDEEVIIQDYNIVKKKHIRRTLLVNDKIIEEETVISNKYPIHHVYIDHNGSPNKTYGIIHKIHDLVKAMNKFWSAMIHDVMSNNNKKILYPTGAFLENSDVERLWNLPSGAFIEYSPDNSLANDGLPTIIEPSPINPAYPHLLEMLRSLIEYVTGINGIMQGNNNGATSTFGGISALQNFGTQRIKLYARNIEDALSDMAYNIVTYLQHFAPTDKILTYFDENNDGQEVILLNDFRDIPFKVRVDITNSLPTQRQAAVQMLGMIAQTAQDPYVQKLLTELMLKNMDMPEGTDIQEKLNTIEQMSQQLQQQEQQIKQQTGTIQALEHNLTQSKASAKVAQEQEKAIGNIKAEEASIMAQMQPQEEQEEENVSINNKGF